MGFSEAKPRTWSLTRSEQAKLEREPLDVVEVGEGFYLLRLLFDMGPTVLVPDFGLQSASWERVHAFKESIDRDWEWWELKALRLMSIAYTQGFREGEEPLSVQPSQVPGWADGKAFKF